MRKTRRFFNTCMIFALLICLVTTTVSATVASAWRQRIGGFAVIDEDTWADEIAYTSVLQMIMVSMGEPYYSLVGGSRAVDGIFGSNTGDAVSRYRQNNGLSNSRVCDSNTWKKLADELDDEPNANGYTYFSMGGDYIMMSTSSSPYKFRYYLIENGNPQLSSVFHTSLS